MTGTGEPVAAARPPRLLRALDGATQALNVAGTMLILGLTLLIGVDVVGRSTFDAPVAGVPELVSLSIVAIVFLQIPAALRAGRLTRSEAVIGHLRRAAPRAAQVLETAFDAAAIAVVGVIVYATWPLLDQAWTRGEFVGALGDFTAPTWPVKAVVVIGGTMLILQFAARIVARATGLAR